MNPSLQSIEEILAGAIEIPVESQRRKYVEDACRGDAELRRKVDELIGWHFAAGKFLDQPPAASTTFIPDPIDVSAIIVGRYKLIEQIGEGSFGAVFRAEQREPVRRFVALKILKPGMNTREVVARFEAERQALALMDHPNIARVYDAGSTDEGRPFFVMELVRGIPITEYADHSRLTMASRLELFIKVCHAVQHAHQKGIIHRDIKPTNVLVSMDEGEPVPKVIDFGVAKAINQRLTAGTVNTHFAQLVGTPLYMSPEQAEMSPIEIDTRSDIYSLGVLLYELLTGTTPLAKERLNNASFDELRRLIREDHPLPPSARLSTLGNLSATVADLRRTDFRKLTHIVRGELDWIVMKALEKDRTLRYETADAFARDIERYLNNEPVEACRPSSAYRLRKFVVRNRAALATASVVLVTLFTGLAVSRFLIARERDRAVEAYHAANKSAIAEAESSKRASEQAMIAAAAATEAKAERTIAVRERNIAVENLYFAHMQLAQQDWQAGQVNRMHESLEAHIPRPGETDLRGWEWYYLLSLCHRDERTLSG
ncbi:MAG: serine/threonine protein kinase, partial [Planctomycetaceae bacterium]